MKKTDRPETVALKEQHAGERKLFLGKLSDDDFIPGSDISIKEAKKSWAKTNEEFNKARIDRRARVLDQKPLSESDDIEFEKRTQTSIVVPGVLVDIELPGQTLASVVTSDLIPALPADEVLQKMEVKDLIALAVVHSVDVKANVDDRPTMIAKLKGTWVEPVKDDLKGKQREELEKIGNEIGLESGNKELYPKNEDLAGAIRLKRESGGV